MTTFTIDADNNITALTGTEATPSGSEAFASEKDLLRIAAEWPAERLVEIWNSIPGVTAATRFTNRKAAVARVWKAIQGLAKPAPEAKPAKKAAGKKEPKAKGKAAKTSKPEKAKPAKATKPAKDAKSAKEAMPARDGSKKAQVLEMMRRKGGATLAEIMKATDWQAHTVRSFISAALGKKMGITVLSTKSDSGERTYSVTK